MRSSFSSEVQSLQGANVFKPNRIDRYYRFKEVRSIDLIEFLAFLQQFVLGVDNHEL